MKGMDYIMLEKAFELRKQEDNVEDSLKVIKHLTLSDEARGMIEEFNALNWDEIRQKNVSAQEYLHLAQ